MNIAENGRIRYLPAKNEGVEIVSCENRRLSYPLHSHVSVFTVGMVLSGSVRLTLNGRARELGRGETFVIPPYAPHTLESQEPCTLLCICVDKKAAERRTGRRSLKAMLAEASNKSFGFRRLNRRQLAKLGRALDLLEKMPPRAAKKTRPHIEMLREQLESYPELDISVEEMSRRTHTGKYHLIRSFRQEVGLTPHRFQIQNRVRKARHLLECSVSMTEAALAAGFADQSHFIRQFKKIVGMTPTSYLAARKLIQGGDEFRKQE